MRLQYHRLLDTICTFLSVLKLVKYFRLYQTTDILLTTLEVALPSLLVYGIVFLLIFNGFIFLYMNIYGLSLLGGALLEPGDPNPLPLPLASASPFPSSREPAPMFCTGVPGAPLGLVREGSST
jgi:hypothetical protein